MQVGAALKQLFSTGVVKRSDLWITSKLWWPYYSLRLYCTIDFSIHVENFIRGESSDIGFVESKGHHYSYHTATDSCMSDICCYSFPEWKYIFWFFYFQLCCLWITPSHLYYRIILYDITWMRNPSLPTDPCHWHTIRCSNFTLA